MFLGQRKGYYIFIYFIEGLVLLEKGERGERSNSAIHSDVSSDWLEIIFERLLFVVHLGQHRVKIFTSLWESIQWLLIFCSSQPIILLLVLKSLHLQSNCLQFVENWRPCIVLLHHLTQQLFSFAGHFFIFLVKSSKLFGVEDHLLVVVQILLPQLLTFLESFHDGFPDTLNCYFPFLHQFLIRFPRPLQHTVSKSPFIH